MARSRTFSARGVAVLCFVAMSYGLVRWAGTRPSFDAYGWLVWGHQTIGGTLNLSGAPTWKPLTWLFTTPFALAGRSGAMWLWMTTATTLGLAGVACAGRATHHLATLTGLSRQAAMVGAIGAGGMLLGIHAYAHYVLSVQSDPVIVTLCLAALDLGLRGRHRPAVVALALASLGRPEAWPFLGCYAVWLWRREPPLRWFVAAALGVVPLLWFGVPAITNGSLLLAGQTALNSPRALHSNQIGGTLSRFGHIQALPVAILALIGATWGAWRRDRRLIAVTVAVAGWVVVEIAFAFHGWAALPRYMFEAAAGETVLAGVGLAALAAGLLAPRHVIRLATPVLAVAALLTLVPHAVDEARAERRDLRIEHRRTQALEELALVIRGLGGPMRVRDCGRPATSVRFVSALAYLTGLNVGSVGHHPNRELHRRHASVFVLPLPDGWSILPWHLRPADETRCEILRSAFLFPRGDADGDRYAYIPASFR